METDILGIQPDMIEALRQVSQGPGTIGRATKGTIGIPFYISFLQKYHISLKFNFAFIAKSTYLSLYIFLFGKLISYSITISKVYILR